MRISSRSIRSFMLLVAGWLAFTAARAPRMEDFLHWEDGLKLSRSDFRGKPDPGSNMKAMTHSGIAYSWQCNAGSFEFEVTARFDREKSWMKPGAESLVPHEQGHFDITEIYARKMRKAFSELAHPCRGSAQIDRIADEIYAEWDVMQDRYDSETNHALNKAIQKEWEKWIAGELESLEDWAIN